jgi:hypothetical protein
MQTCFCPLFSSLAKSLRLLWSLTSCINWLDIEKSTGLANSGWVSGRNLISVGTGNPSQLVAPQKCPKQLFAISSFLISFFLPFFFGSIGV